MCLFPQQGDVCKDCTQIFELLSDIISDQSFEVTLPLTHMHSQTHTQQMHVVLQLSSARLKQQNTEEIKVSAWLHMTDLISCLVLEKQRFSFS